MLVVGHYTAMPSSQRAYKQIIILHRTKKIMLSSLTAGSNAGRSTCLGGGTRGAVPAADAASTTGVVGSNRAELGTEYESTTGAVGTIAREHTWEIANEGIQCHGSVDIPVGGLLPTD
jgi:hypothetical protein